MTLIATRSMPTVSCLSTSVATLSFVPTPSVQRHQDRVFVVPREQPAGEIELKQPRKAAVELQHPRRKRAVHQPRQARHRLVIDVEIDAGVFVSDFGH